MEQKIKELIWLERSMLKIKYSYIPAAKDEVHKRGSLVGLFNASVRDFVISAPLFFVFGAAFAWMRFVKDWRGIAVTITAIAALVCLFKIIFSLRSLFTFSDEKNLKKEANKKLSNLESELSDAEKKHKQMTDELIKMKKSLGLPPEEMAKKLYFEIPFDIYDVHRKETHNLRNDVFEAGELNFFQLPDDDECFVDGYRSDPVLKFHQLKTVLTHPDGRILGSNVPYLLKHEDEEYTVKFVHYATGRYCERTRTIHRANEVDVAASMKKYRDELDSMERNLTGGTSFAGLLWSDKISLGQYNTAESIKNSMLKDREEALLRHNRNATVQVTDLPTYEIADNIIGLIVYNKQKKPVLEIAADQCFQSTVVEFEMLKTKTYEHSTLDYSETRKPIGKVVNFRGGANVLPGDYIAFINHLSGIEHSLTEVCPENVPEDAWKYMIFRCAPSK